MGRGAPLCNAEKIGLDVLQLHLDHEIARVVDEVLQAILEFLLGNAVLPGQLQHLLDLGDGGMRECYVVDRLPDEVLR